MSQKIAKNRIIYECKICDYNTHNKSDYNKHVETIKHKNACFSTKINLLATEKSQKSQEKTFECDCGKKYKDKSGLWRHHKQCQYIKPNENNIVDIIQNHNTEQMKLFTEAIKTTVIEVMKNGSVITNNNNTNNNSNSHNKTFNLNLYLNETCKDAINIEDFVKSIKVQIEDLEYTGRQGYVDGITNIILNNLHSIHVHQRPIHCTDEKREILYIKNEGEWIKEADNKPVLTNAIKTIANENIKQINEWTQLYPDCKEADSKKNNLYLKIVSNSMSGGTKDECCKNYNKIIRNIVRDTTIDKDDCVP